MTTYRAAAKSPATARQMYREQRAVAVGRGMSAETFKAKVVGWVEMAATADRKAGLDVREYALYAWGAYVVANGSPPPR